MGLSGVPKDVQPGERRPVVVCQHGRDGLPRNLLDRNLTGYRNVAAVLAERGFITFAPHNLYRGEDRYRWLDRKANTVKATLFSFIVAQHDQILRWLETQPFVDGSRIGFYGLSYGGETAMRVPPLLEKYALSICAGDLNNGLAKCSDGRAFSFMRTIEWRCPMELGTRSITLRWLILWTPRPLMSNRGQPNLVGRDHWGGARIREMRWHMPNSASLSDADRFLPGRSQHVVRRHF